MDKKTKIISIQLIILLIQVVFGICAMVTILDTHFRIIESTLGNAIEPSGGGLIMFIIIISGLITNSVLTTGAFTNVGDVGPILNIVEVIIGISLLVSIEYLLQQIKAWIIEAIKQNTINTEALLKKYRYIIKFWAIVLIVSTVLSIANGIYDVFGVNHDANPEAALPIEMLPIYIAMSIPFIQIILLGILSFLAKIYGNNVELKKEQKLTI